MIFWASFAKSPRSIFDKYVYSFFQVSIQNYYFSVQATDWGEARQPFFHMFCSLINVVQLIVNVGGQKQQTNIFQIYFQATM